MVSWHTAAFDAMILAQTAALGGGRRSAALRGRGFGQGDGGRTRAGLRRGFACNGDQG
jgi:hypothetical protein